MDPDNFHIMVDLETMSSNYNAAIIAIGAVRFDPTDPVGEIIDSFYARVSLESSVRAGGHMSPSTVDWWLHPDRADARAALLAGEAVELSDALIGFREWFGPKSLPLWGNGATFDNVILRHAYNIDYPAPWKYTDDRCFRTMKNLFPLTDPVPPPTGVAHHALYDALYQTFQLQAMWKQMQRMAMVEANQQASHNPDALKRNDRWPPEIPA